MATKHKKKSKQQTTDPYVTRANLATALKFNPQLSALVELARQAQDRRDYGVKLAKGNARATQALIDQQSPRLQQVFTDAGVQAGPPPPAPTLPAGTVDFASAAKYEGAASQHRGSQSMADALAGLQEQKVLAQQGGTFGSQQAQSQYADDLDKISRQQQDLQGQAGDFSAKTLMDLVDEGNKRRDADRQKQLDRDQSNTNNIRTNANKGNSSDSKRLPGGAKLATPIQHGAFTDAVGSAQAQVEDLLSTGYSAAEIRKALVEGIAATTVTNSKGQKVKIPAVPSFPPLVAGVAVDLLTGNKVLSKQAIRQLHSRGLSIRKLGYPTKPKTKVAHAIGSVGKPPAAPIRF